jgi:hypothetical protein
VLQIVQQAQQHIQQLESELRDAKTGIEKARISAESSERVAQINANSRQDVEELKGWIAMLMESMRPPPALNAAAMKTQEQQNQEPTTRRGLASLLSTRPASSIDRGDIHAGSTRAANIVAG